MIGVSYICTGKLFTRLEVPPVCAGVTRVDARGSDYLPSGNIPQRSWLVRPCALLRERRRFLWLRSFRRPPNHCTDRSSGCWRPTLTTPALFEDLLRCLSQLMAFGIHPLLCIIPVTTSALSLPRRLVVTFMAPFVRLPEITYS